MPVASPAVRATALRRLPPTGFVSLAASASSASSTLNHRPRSRLFTSSSARTAEPSSATEGRKPGRDKSKVKESKIQTIPFVLAPKNGLSVCETAAHSAFGVSSVFALLVSRFLRRFGYEFDTGVEQLAFKPLLLPTWKVDIAMKGKALLDDTELNLTVSAVDASIPGFDLSPLDELTVSSPWDVDPVPFSRSEHSTQHDQEITILPFTRSPLKLLDKIAAAPRTTAEKHGLVVNPARFKSVLFAAYPLYLPLYLGEFKLGQKRVTTVAFATLDGQAFAFYPQWTSSPSWLPPTGSVEVGIAGRPSLSSSDLESPRPAVMNELPGRVQQLFEAFSEDRKDAAGEVDDKFETEPFEGSVEELVDASPRAMGYAEHAAPNRLYIQAQSGLESAKGLLEQIAAMPDQARALFIGPTGPRLQDRATILAELTSKHEKAKLLFQHMKPEWLEELERQEEQQRINKWHKTGRGR
ncbi:hypothetical protein JCM21900_001463 [Sporobolomyces salmonicolor]